MLHIHRADRADALVAELGDLLAAPPADAFAPEVVAVPTRGMERWLTQKLSGVLGASPGRADGICANVEFPSPRRLVGDAVASASGIEPDRDPWLAERAVWPLLSVIDGALGEPWLELLTAHLRGGPADDAVRGPRRFTVARHLSELFDRYAVRRPEMVLGWHTGSDPELWQAELWRRLRAVIETPSLAERLADAGARLRSDASVVDLPERLALFGLTRIPAGHLEILRAIAAQRDVHLFLLHPSPALWERVAAGLPEGPVVRRAEDPTATLPVNRLLATWGRDAREMQLVLAGGSFEDHLHPGPARAKTLLGRLQHDVGIDAGPPAKPPPLAPDDDSLRIHACHGRARQVEVLRDALLHLFQDDDTLEPRDVIVMCPDIETFAPLLHATFGAGESAEDEEEDDGGPKPPDLRVRLADRSLRQTNPVLGVVGGLLELAGRRVTASQLLDLADREPVRRRFRFDDDELARIEEWVAESGIRWGLDAAHRAPYKLDAVTAGTWSAGLDRVLLGAAMTEDGHRRFADTLPLDDVDSGAVDLAGRLAELVDRLGAALGAFHDEQPIADWASALVQATHSLTATTPGDSWQHAELEWILADVVDEADGSDVVLSMPEVRTLLARRLEGRPTRANFRTGHLTVCTLMPMRSVPHRVVCLLGLDDEVFPRKSPRDGDDLTLADPHVGERDGRSEDRQLLLDALMAAGERLIVTYTGKDERTNVARPPSVPVGELLDVVDRTVRVEDGRPRDRVIVHHPLQPFDPRNFTAGELAPGGVWSFDPVTLEGAQALCGDRTTAPPFLEGPLPADPPALVEVDQLVRFTAHPAGAFLRERLGFGVRDYDDDLQDALPVELDALQQWGVGDRLLQACLAGVELEEALAAERSRGSLPPGELAAGVLQRVRPRVERIANAARSELGDGGEPSSLDVKVDLGGGRLLSGSVAGVYGDLVASVIVSRVGPKHRLASWVRWLALTAARPERSFEAVVVGRARAGAKDADVTVARLTPPDGDRQAFALEQLRVLLDLFDRGMREPLPLACGASEAYARVALAGADAVKAGTSQWESAWSFDREDKDPEHLLVFGRVLSFEELLAMAPREDEAGPGWDDDEPSRFGRYARRLWAGPLSGVEQVSDW